MERRRSLDWSRGRNVLVTIYAANNERGHAAVAMRARRGNGRPSEHEHEPTMQVDHAHDRRCRMSEGQQHVRDRLWRSRLWPSGSRGIGELGDPDHPEADPDDQLGREVGQRQGDREIETRECSMWLDRHGRRATDASEHGEVQNVRQRDVGAGGEAERPARRQAGPNASERRYGALGNLVEIEIPGVAQPADRQKKSAVVEQQATVPGAKRRH